MEPSVAFVAWAEASLHPQPESVAGDRSDDVPFNNNEGVEERGPVPQTK